MSTIVCGAMGDIPNGWYLMDCAVSGGTMEDYLARAMRAAQGRLCVRIAPVYMDFPLPCPGGIGKPLTRAQAEQLRGEAELHNSPALSTCYFTGVWSGQAHVVLMDTEQSLLQKLRLAKKHNVPMVLAEDPAVRALLEKAPHEPWGA